MSNLFEIYLTDEVITAGQWQTLYLAIKQYAGILSSFRIIFTCDKNIVRYFVACEDDLSALSTNIDGVIIRKCNENEIVIPDSYDNFRFMSFVTGGSLLDLKEKYMVKKALDLEFALFDVRPINDSNAVISARFLFKTSSGAWVESKKKLITFPTHLLQVNFTENSKYLHHTVPRYLNIEKSMHMLASENMNALFSVDSFPYFAHDYFLNVTSYEFDQHSFIIGSSGSGKSKFISLFIDRLQKTALTFNYRIVVIDPHAALEDDLGSFKDSQIIRFDKDNIELFASMGSDVSAATELTATLFKSLMAEQYTPRLDRLLRFTLYVLFTAQSMSFDTLKLFLTNIELRHKILDHVNDFVPANIIRFFGADFNEIRTQYYNEVISPLVTLVDEMQLQPALVGDGDVPLAKTINDNFLTVFSLNKVKMGQKVVKTVAGLIIQQIFLLAQSHSFNQKVILIIDEVSVIQTPALASILAEARKYNLYVFLTQQYFGQIEDDLKAAIFANVYNYYVFRTSEEDARELEGNLRIELPKELIRVENARGIKETDLRVRMLTELHPRECLVRLLSKGQLNPCLKVRTLDLIIQPKELFERQFLPFQPEPSIQLPTKFRDAGKVNLSDSLSRIDATSPIQELPVAPSTPSVMMNLAEIMSLQSSGRKKTQLKKGA